MAQSKHIQANDTKAIEAAAKEAEASLPAAGHARQETLKQRQDHLSAEAERIASQIMAGTVDASKMDVINDVAQRTQFLNVSNQQPGWVYGWISKNHHGHHIERMRNYGWQVVQGEDPEAIELKGSSIGSRSLGSPGTTRELADVILMKIPQERYVVLRAMEIAHTRKVQAASSAGLIELGRQNAKHGVVVRPYGMAEMSGPEIRPGKFTNKENAQRMMTEALKAGSVPGMEINQ